MSNSVLPVREKREDRGVPATHVRQKSWPDDTRHNALLVWRRESPGIESDEDLGTHDINMG
jgi:hypothetical protein